MKLMLMRTVGKNQLTVEPRYNEVLSMTSDFLYSSNCKIYEKEPRNNETSLYRTNFASPLALRYLEVPLSRSHTSLNKLKI